jgi:hypothetical protein
MNSNIFNSIILSNEQVNYLMGGTAGINRLSCLSTHSDCDTTD